MSGPVTGEAEPQRQGRLIGTALLADLETTARELAQAAGAEITAALGRSVSVDYKTEGKPNEGALPPIPSPRSTERSKR